MNGNKLIQVLSSLTKEEWIAYRKYLLMHTSEESDNYKVFAYLQKRKDNLDQLKGIEEIRRKHFDSLSTKSMLNILSRLYLWLEECLIHQSIVEDEKECQLRLVKLYNRRGLYNLADQKARKLTKVLDSDTSLCIDKPWIKSQMKYYQYFSDNPIKEKEDILRQLANQLIEAHAAQKLLVYNELTNINRRTKNYSALVERFDTHIDLASTTPLNSTLLSLNRLIKNDSVEDFKHLKHLLLSGSYERQSDLEILLCMYLFSAAFDMIALYKSVEATSIIEIVNYGLENRLITAGGQLSAPRYMNLINAISKVNSIEDTITFIDQWAESVSGEDTESIKIFSLALCLTIKNRYDEIPLQPTLLYFKNIHLKFSSISLYLFTNFNYSRHNYEILYDTISILKRTLRRYKKELTKEYYEGYLNFTKVVSLLVEKKSVNLKDYTPIMHKPWLSKQIDQ